MERRNHDHLKSKINNEVHVLILGSYQRRHKSRLLSLRDTLKEAGFTQTHLVEDFPDDHVYHNDLDIHFTKKSEHYIVEWADEILFVLFRDSDNQGVLSEFRFCSIMDEDVLENSLIEAEDGVHLSSQVMGPIKLTKINTVTFTDEGTLLRRALGHTVKTVERLYSKLVERSGVRGTPRS